MSICSPLQCLILQPSCSGIHFVNYNGVVEIFNLMEKPDHNKNQFFNDFDKIKNACTGLDKELSNNLVSINRLSWAPHKGQITLKGNKPRGLGLERLNFVSREGWWVGGGISR